MAVSFPKRFEPCWVLVNEANETFDALERLIVEMVFYALGVLVRRLLLDSQYLKEFDYQRMFLLSETRKLLDPNVNLHEGGVNVVDLRA
jgi:hypothetical protein